MSLILIPVAWEMRFTDGLDEALDEMRRAAPEHTFIAVPGMTGKATFITTYGQPAVPPPVDRPNNPLISDAG